MLYVNGTDAKGRGCFTDRAIECGELIVAEVLTIKKPDKPEAECFGEPWEHCLPWSATHWCLAMSELSFCNHSYNPNTMWGVDREKKQFILRAMRRIEADTEITIDYCFTSEPWFEVRA